MANDQMTALETLLDRLHSALLQGDLGALEEIEAQITPLLPTAPAPAGDMRRIAQKAAANRALLLAAGKGVRAAQRRLAEIERVLAGHGFYDSRGRMSAGVGHGRAPIRRF